MKVSKAICRSKTMRRIRRDMEKDIADPGRIAKWLKIMEYKKKLFAIEDEIDKVTRQLNGSKD